MKTEKELSEELGVERELLKQLRDEGLDGWRKEGNWIKVSDRLVDKVLDELNSKVLQHMPLTDLGNMSFLIKADADKISHLSDEKEYPLAMNVSLSYRSIAPELSGE